MSLRTALLILALIPLSIMASCPQPSACETRPRFGGSVVYAYPSTGGYVRKHLTRPELDWLGLTFDPTAEKNFVYLHPETADAETNQEDSFSLRLMQLGGRWWKSQQYFNHHFGEAEWPYGHHFPPDLDVGYPASGGVLVLRTFAENSLYRSDLPDTLPEKPEHYWELLSVCATMEERCAALRKLGAVFYDSIEDVTDLPNSVEDGVAQARNWEELMDKMDDRDYVEKFLF
ncbi:hypothetical protein CKM354_000642700 [Cercospora kikuchii]|uniref:Uncharacterized protein n=1 Tax=Cercospora kikuchii TaxID=84275 RepID=A0A9P3CHX3_9PEZI|nr:uncharacterized protein CKM354_000642700 [Cercospora kikuchii]GIZ43189.1 hypothetical protein CKM354_000642700 [Cercospora kikuchii]